MKIKLFFLLLFTGQLMAQQIGIVDFLKAEVTVEPIFAEKKVKGTAKYTFYILQKTDSVYLDARKMMVTDVALEGIQATAAAGKIWLIGPFDPGREYVTFFSYVAQPTQSLYFTGDQVWTQGQGKYTSHWLPSIDDMNDKIEFDLTIKAPHGSTVIANGSLLSTKDAKEMTYWEWDMERPMSSYLVAFAIGDFNKLSITTAAGVPVELYYDRKDAAKAEATYQYSKEIFHFLETEIGVAYPWQNYKQVPVRDFLYAGMENTTATIFSEAFVVDSIAFNDRNYVNVNAHELAHQWFGNLVTETEGTHHWLHEGFATYYALLAEKEIFGEDYFYWKLYNSAEQLVALSEQGKGESLLNSKASSLTFYEKGAWALHILKELIGEDDFRRAIQNYLNRFQFTNVTTQDFLYEVKAVAAVDIAQWEADWLHQSAFMSEQVYTSLIESEFIRDFFAVSALRQLPLKDKLIQLKTALTFPNDFIGQEAIYQLDSEPISETIPLYKKGFDSNNLYVRQAIALSLEIIPEQLKTEYESLLDDASYVTREAALYLLCSQFPEKRFTYLNKLKAVYGFQNKNIRQLWLYLAITTEGYEEADKKNFVKELESYTTAAFSFEIRENAFAYMFELNPNSEVFIRSLVDASIHHYWRFRDSARHMLAEIMTNDTTKKSIVTWLDSFSEKEQLYLTSKFDLQ
jgi:aminopeptidase N